MCYIEDQIHEHLDEEGHLIAIYEEVSEIVDDLIDNGHEHDLLSFEEADSNVDYMIDDLHEAFIKDSSNFDTLLNEIKEILIEFVSPQIKEYYA